MIINRREIGLNQPPYIIAEMSANHNGSIDNAFKIIEMASDSGADAVKLQTYRYQRRLHGKQNYLQSALTIKS